MLTYQAPTSNFWSTTTNGTINDSVDTITLQSTTGLQSPGVVVIDREDGNGTATPNAREVISYTGISGTDLTGCTRGAENSTARSHSSGALVEAVLSVGQWNDLVDSYQVQHNDAGTHKQAAMHSLGAFLNLPEGVMYNGKIVPSVSSNNLTLDLKGMDGNDPSATNPVYIRINGTVRSVTAALSAGTYNAGSNYFDMGSAEFATKEVDIFVYAFYNSTSGVGIAFSRVPYAQVLGDMVDDGANEKGYISASTHTAADSCVNIGRFSAILSAGAGYTWSVPTFTSGNLVQRPIYETRWLTWLPTYGGSASMTFGTVTTTRAKYKIIGNVMFIRVHFTGTTGGTAASGITFTVPLAIGATDETFEPSAPAYVVDTAGSVGTVRFNAADHTIASAYKSDLSNFGLGADRKVVLTLNYDLV